MQSGGVLRAIKVLLRFTLIAGKICGDQRKPAIICARRFRRSGRINCQLVFWPKECKMKNLMSVSLAYVLVAVTALPQSNAQQSGYQMKRGHNTVGKMPTNTIRKTSGMISADGRTFVSDEDNRTLTVSNPGALKGYEGHQVTLKAQINAAKNVIHVVSVKT